MLCNSEEDHEHPQTPTYIISYTHTYIDPKTLFASQYILLDFEYVILSLLLDFEYVILSLLLDFEYVILSLLLDFEYVILSLAGF